MRKSCTLFTGASSKLGLTIVLTFQKEEANIIKSLEFSRVFFGLLSSD